MDNSKFLVLRIVSNDSPRMVTEVYLLNPGDFFHGFGGSRHGLPVKKTGSLVVRQSSTWGVRDVEYNLADAGAWEAIRTCLAMGRIEMQKPAPVQAAAQ